MLSPKISNADLGIESYIETKPKHRITNPTAAEKILMDLHMNEENFATVPVYQAKFG